MDVPIPFIINDTRNISLFNKKSYSGYKKGELLNYLNKNILLGKLGEVCNLGVECIISGYFEDIWEKIMELYTKYINTHSPYLSYYFYNKLIIFLKITKQEYFTKVPLDLRNSQQVRNMFCELLCVLNNTTKHRTIRKLVKINKNDFNPDYFKKRLTANDYSISVKILEKEDPKELLFVINEISLHLDKMNYNLNHCIYWLSWILEWEKINLNKKNNYDCAYRDIPDIDKKFKKDFIWILWDVIIKEGEKRNSDLLNQLKSINVFFKYKYSQSKKKKRIYFIITSFELLNPELTFDNYMKIKYPIFENYNLILLATSNINTLYKEFKKTENLQNSIINSKIKQEATNVLIKYDKLDHLNNISIQRQKEKEMKELIKQKNKIKNRKKEDLTKYKQHLIESIDNNYINNPYKNVNNNNINNVFYNNSDYNHENNISENNNNKIINIINNIDNRIENKNLKNIKNQKNKIINLTKLN